ncbi:SEL1-like repeat protein [Pulveribacter suum]|uniref:Sel1 repeat family protein n=1 Tax=Pulveribacter suum TaxID=2116657 RepID=A0A2P1NJG6_9BURK|nr:sel1 repeat family protein [Pulveribacter suum]AVP57195.1 sel1 repeat family protein [Pulveribacter suum]
MQHALIAALLLCTAAAQAQTAAGAPAMPAQGALPAGAGAPAASTGARFLESCNLSLQKGVTDLGCQGPLYRNELQRLQREALATQNPQLLSLVGDAYGSRRSGLADAGQAYRWYLLAAVRGDPHAMQRLAEMNRQGTGTPQDKVKALGYARLAQRLALPGTAEAGQDVAQVIDQLGAEMAVEEVALAERFAAELQAQVQHAGPAAPGASAAAPSTVPGSGLPGVPLPGRSDPGATALPGARLPGTPPSQGR